MFEINFNSPIHIYFVGIGGISMSGLAEILLKEGFTISGSDMSPSPLTEKLIQLGARIYYGQSVSHLTLDVDLVVYTAAIHEDNPEWIAMKSLKLPSLSRAELLGQMMRNYEFPIAVSGTHGKTTTTSMVGQILMNCNTDPTLSIGGILPSIGGNIRIGNSPYFVTEACEYTNSFLSFFPKVGIILNVEEDHMDFFHDIHEIRKSFHEFAALLPEDGVLIINGEIEDLPSITEGLKCNVLTFGTSPEFNYYAKDIHFTGNHSSSFTFVKQDKASVSVELGVPGLHNVLNALASLVLADWFHLKEEDVLSALRTFTGSKRRFEHKGELGGVTIIDDYAHHPTEIRATLETGKHLSKGTLWCVFQPHTYTRTKAFLPEFAEALALADKIVLADIYAARETDTLGISSADLKDEIISLGKECYHFSTFDEIETFLLKNIINGDLLITMGAGDIVTVGENLLGL